MQTETNDCTIYIIPIHLSLVCPHLSPLQVLNPSDLSLNQMITVDGGGNRHLGQTTADELKHRHLSCSVLHSHAVWTQTQIGAATVDLLACWVIQVTVHNLLRQSERPAEPGGVD